MVRRRSLAGLDSVNDGELSKFNFTDYIRLRLDGLETRPARDYRRLEITARDERKFAEYFKVRPRSRAPGEPVRHVCVAPLKYVGAADLQRDLDNFRAALEGVEVAEAFLPANTPGTVEHWLANEHYPDEESFVFAIADALERRIQAPSSTPASSSRSTIPTCRTGGTACPTWTSPPTGNTPSCVSPRSTTRSTASRPRRCACTSAGAASTAHTTTTSRSPTSST